MIDNYIIEHPSYQYALSVVNDEIIAGKYIKKECQKFLEDIENEESPYYRNKCKRFFGRFPVVFYYKFTMLETQK